MDANTKALNWASVIIGLVVGALTAWFIFRRTIARARELEAEEERGGRTTSQVPEFSDDPEEQAATATLIRDDQIDFLGPEGRRDEYRDEFSEDEDDVFRFGDGPGDEERGISLGRQQPHR